MFKATEMQTCVSRLMMPAVQQTFEIRALATASSITADYLAAVGANSMTWQYHGQLCQLESLIGHLYCTLTNIVYPDKIVQSTRAVQSLPLPRHLRHTDSPAELQ